MLGKVVANSKNQIYNVNKQPLTKNLVQCVNCLLQNIFLTFFTPFPTPFFNTVCTVACLLVSALPIVVEK